MLDTKTIIQYFLEGLTKSEFVGEEHIREVLSKNDGTLSISQAFDMLVNLVGDGTDEAYERGYDYGYGMGYTDAIDRVV